jgi:hypothetical protein
LATPSLIISGGTLRASRSPPPVVAGYGIQKERSMVLTISNEDYVRMQTAALDRDEQDALRLIKEFVKRLELQKRQGLKSHLD